MSQCTLPSIAAFFTCRGVGDFPVLAGTAAHVKIFGVIAHRPSLSQPGFIAATTTVFTVNSPLSLLSSPLLNDYLHLVTSYPIQQVLAPRFVTRSFETLCDAGTSPGAKPNNFSRLTIHDDHNDTIAGYNSSVRALHLDRHHTALPLLPSLPNVKFFNYQQRAPSPELLSQRWFTVMAFEVGHNAVEHPIPHFLSLYSTSPQLRMACTT